uniref:CSON014194 protein n=2 Tax=Culicoides sonorensis TaxID=179676 RepID=A0A336KRN5_CULSO
MFCCWETFENSFDLLEHIEAKHFSALRKFILTKKDFILKCIENADLPIVRVRKKPQMPQVVLFKEETDPEITMKENISMRINEFEPQIVAYQDIYQPIITNIFVSTEENESIHNESISPTHENFGLDETQINLEVEYQKPEDQNILHEEKFICNFCETEFYTKNELTNHFLSEHNLQNPMINKNLDENLDNDSFKCDICEKNFKDKSFLLSHIREVHCAKSRIVCTFCYKKFPSKSQANEHKKTHDTDPQIPCFECGKICKGQSHLKKHMKEHRRKPKSLPLKNDPNLSCKICQKTFAIPARLRIHEINVHGIGETSFVCLTCGKGFASNYDLKVHSKRHSEEKPFECSECKMSFKRINNLKSHIENHHTENTEVKCPLCSSLLKTKRSLRKHAVNVHKITMTELHRKAGIPYKGRDILHSIYVLSNKYIMWSKSISSVLWQTPSRRSNSLKNISLRLSNCDKQSAQRKISLEQFRSFSCGNQSLKMRFIQFQRKNDQSTRLGVISNDGSIVTDLSESYPTDMKSFIQSNVSLNDVQQKVNSGTKLQLSDVKLLAPINNPEKIICIGLNYKGHCEEQNKTPPTEPMFFTKFASCIVGPSDDIIAHKITDQIDWEVELAVVIGKEAKHVARESAMDYVFGYCVAQDISARDWQKVKNGGQFTIGKGMDTFCPLGPAIVHKCLVADPHNLTIKCSVDGVSKQSGSTSELIFRIDDMISRLSQSITLKPGDVLLTGTPAGVGMHRSPPEFLRVGNVVESEIQNLGKITNKVVADN